MGYEPKRSIEILFRAPSGDLPHHEREVEGVPHSMAVQMAEDFEKYGKSEASVSPHQLYRFEVDGEEQLAALDFTEVVGIFV